MIDFYFFNLVAEPPPADVLELDRPVTPINVSMYRKPGFYTKGRPLVKSNLICPSDKLSWQPGCPVLNINIP